MAWKFAHTGVSVVLSRISRGRNRGTACIMLFLANLTDHKDVIGDLEAALVHACARREAGHDGLLLRVDVLAQRLKEGSLQRAANLTQVSP